MLTCYIVDDNEMARLILQQYIRQCGELLVEGEFGNGQDTFKAFERKPVDLLFLDIEMPEMTGLELLGMLPKMPFIIFTTASRAYATEAFDKEAVDYLVKPVTYPRFLQAIEKVKWRKAGQEALAQSPLQPSLFVKAGKAMHRLHIAEVLWVEGLGDYVKIKTATQVYTIYSTMKDMEEKLEPHGFLRIHRSYIVALRHVASIKKYSVLIAGHELPVSESYRDKLTGQVERL